MLKYKDGLFGRVNSLQYYVLGLDESVLLAYYCAANNS
jgi:hypothetical protein